MSKGDTKSRYDGDICMVDTPFARLRILEDLSSDENPDDDCDHNDHAADIERHVEDAVGRFVWPTAVPLLRHLLDDNGGDDAGNVIFKPPSLIVELGAGCGVLGMGLAAAATASSREKASVCEGSVHIILTDHDNVWLERNLALNEAVLGETSASTTTVTVARLDWKNPDDLETVRSMIQERFAAADNSNIPWNELVLVASDVLYNHASHKALASTLYELSQLQPSLAGSCRVILGFPDRDNDEEHFLPIAKEFFGESLVRSQPIRIQREPNRRGKTMDLRVIDFRVGGRPLL